MLKQTHAILTDTLASVAKDQSGKSTAGLISAQKIRTISQSNEGKAMIGSLISLYGKFQTYIKQLEGKHIHDAIKIIFSPEESKMIEGIKKLKTNAESLSQKEASDISSVDEFVKRLLLGENPETKIKSSASEAQTLVEKEDVTSLLQGIEEIKEMIEPLKDVLKNISKLDASESATSQE